MSANLERKAATLRELCEYDEKVMTDRALQQEQSRRREEMERARRKQELEEEERIKHEQAMQRVRDDLAAAQNAQDKLRAELDAVMASKVSSTLTRGGGRERGHMSAV